MILSQHLNIILNSYQHWLHQPLIAESINQTDLITTINQASFALVSHDTQTDPVFNYGNTLALQLFEMSWQEFTQLPSRYSAEAMLRSDREKLLAEVTEKGYSNGYTGVRVSKTGKRFLIKECTVFNLFDDQNHYYGQAACIRQWQHI